MGKYSESHRQSSEGGRHPSLAGQSAEARLLGKVRSHSFVTRLHGFVALMPPQRADFSVLFDMLEGIHDAERLINRTAERHVVHEGVAHHAFLVDQEQPPIGNLLAHGLNDAVLIDKLLAGEHFEVFRNTLVDIGYQRIAHPLNASLLTGGY